MFAEGAPATGPLRGPSARYAGRLGFAPTRNATVRARRTPAPPGSALSREARLACGEAVSAPRGIGVRSVASELAKVCTC